MKILQAVSNTLSRAPLLGKVVHQMISEDPALFAVQLLRRTPSHLRDALSALPEPSHKGSTIRSTWLMMLDRRQQLQDELASAGEQSSSGLLNKIRVQIESELPPSASANDRAHQLWESGNLDEAIALAQPPLRGILESRLRVLTPGRTLVLPSSYDEDEPPTPRKTPAPARPAGDSSSPVRVLHCLTNSLPWTNSGYALRSHQVLLAQRAVGLEVEAITRLAYPLTIGRPWAGTVDEVDSIRYRRLLPASLPRYEDARLALHTKMLADVAHSYSPDVLHTTTNFHNGLVTRAVAEKLDIPWVYEMRGELEKSWVARRPRHQETTALASQRYQLMRARETEMALAADAVVALSHHQADSLVERGIPAAKIHVIPNAVDADLLDVPRNPQSARRSLGLTERAWVGTVSALVDYEGLDTLVRAVASLRKRGVDIGLAIVGDGVSRESLIQLCRNEGLNVHTGPLGESSTNADAVFPGKVAPLNAPSWYQALDVMAIPRRDTPVTRAVTPIKGLQAMALGIPQVVSDLPALVEVGARDGQGLAVSPGDANALADVIGQIIADTDLAESLSSQARKVATGRTWSANAAAYSQLYSSLL
ncbi:glycosyltransferase family 4 protein [Schaalia vaccimaxillae]|uniref:glycosyltransferase family 4 protein n=1 Tax=Schaalia vaccimaxillae TaxID=183916 RepID=UPI0003B36006|nr:glycosyltransferase family 4 protein [Schaalia vaccimaxillae]